MGSDERAERAHGLWWLLRHPLVFEAMQSLSGADRMIRILIDDYIHPRSGMAILDLGCGTSRIAARLEDCSYVGIDNNRRYVEFGRRRLRKAGDRLLHGDFAIARDLPQRYFDVVLAIGLLHHLNDEQSTALLDIAARKLATGGQLVTIDPCLDDAQHRIASWLIRLDRGKNVRTRAGYEAIAARAFANTRSELRGDTLYYPYTHCIMILSDPTHLARTAPGASVHKASRA